MNRREVIAILGGATWSLAASAQVRRIYRLAVVSPSEPASHMSESGINRNWRTLFKELRRLGYSEGQNLKVERYSSDHLIRDFPALADEVVRGGPDVVFVTGAVGARALKAATSTVPIVTLGADPVALGLAQSLNHPGGNFTGVSVDAGASVYGKRLEILREVVPSMRKLGYITLRVNWENVQGSAIREAVQTAGLSLLVHQIEAGASADDFRRAIQTMSQDGVDAVIVDGAEADTMIHHQWIAELIRKARLPALYPFREFVEAGGLMAYAFDFDGLAQRIAKDIDEILKGKTPGDIPYYQSSKFELVINLKTAKALGITIPPTLLARADEVIE
jgi:putative ABC transport system substrate-binding protein